MGKRLKLATGAGFSTIDASPLGQIISLLQLKISSLKQQNAQDHSHPTLERTYSAKLLTAVESRIKPIRSVLNYYEQGGQPSGLKLLGLGASAKSLGESLIESTDFDTPAYAFYRVIERDLKAIIKASLASAKIKTITVENINKFRGLLKEALVADRQRHFAEALRIPGAKLDDYFALLFQLIDHYNFTAFNERDGVKLDELSQALNSAVERCFFVEIGPDRQSRYKPASLQITHPLFYELVYDILSLLLEAPHELEKLLSFLNPSAFALDLKNGGLSSFVPDSFKILIEHTPKPESQFVYTITHNDGIDIVDANEHYQKIFVGLAEAIANYFKNYAASQHVKSELAKTRLLMDFIKSEIELDQSSINEIESSASFLDLQISVGQPGERIPALVELRQSMSNSLVLISEIQARKDANDREPVSSLLTRHKLEANLAQDAQSGLDISYHNYPLPSLLIQAKDDDQVSFVDVLQNITLTEEQQRALEERRGQFTRKIDEIERQIAVEVEIWDELLLEEHKRLNAEFIKQSKEILATAESLLVDELDELPAEMDDRLVVIGQQVDFLEQQKLKFDGYWQNLQNLVEALDKPVVCPEELVVLGSSIARKAFHCYASAREQAVQDLSQLEVAAKKLELQRNRLLIEQSKISAVKELSESLKSADPTVIIKLREAKEEEGRQLFARHEQHKQELADKTQQKQDYAQLLHQINPELNAGLIYNLGQECQGLIQSIQIQASTIIPTLKSFGSSVADNLDGNLLSTLEGAIQASFEFQNFVSAHSDSIKKYGALTIDPSIYTEIKAMDAAAKILIEARGKINFGKLDETLYKIFNPGKLYLPWDNGFNDELLKRLEDPNHTPAIWDKHRKAKQNDERVLLATESLLESMRRRTQAYKEEIINEEELTVFAKRLDSLVIAHSDLEKAKEDRLNVQLRDSSLAEEIALAECKVQEQAKELENIGASIAVLNIVADLLAENQALSKALGELEVSLLELNSAELLNGQQEQLIAAIVAKREELAQLEVKISALEIEVARLDEPAIYQENVDKLKSLSATCKANIAKVVNRICNIKLHDLTETLQAEEQACQALATELDSFASLDLRHKLLLLNRVAPLVEPLPAKVDACALKQKYLHRDLDLNPADVQESAINEFPARMRLVQHELGSVQQSLMLNSAALVADLASTLEGLYEYANQFAANELENSQLENQRLLVAIKERLVSFPTGAELKALETTLPTQTELPNLISNLETLNARLAINQMANSMLAERIAERRDFAEQFKSVFQAYLTNRNKQYKWKDSFYGRDAIKRSDFVSGLVPRLNAYVNTGDAQTIIDFLPGRQELFSGFKLQPIINRMTRELKRQQKRVPEDYEVVVAEARNESAGDEQEKALLVLQALKDLNSVFAADFDTLYKKIALINDFSEVLDKEGLAGDAKVAKALASSLGKEVDLFLINNSKLLKEKNNSPERARLLASFQVDFLCLLHSQNDVLSNYQSLGHIIANIVTTVLSIVSLGTYALLVAGGTKLFFGQASLFFKPDGIEYVEAVDKVVQNIAAPAA